MDKKMYHDVFISYSSQDKETADYLKDVLNSHGISCWMAPYCIPYGSDYADVIPYGIENSSVFILVLSKKAMDSKWVPKELDRAISFEKMIIPFQMEDIKLSQRFNFCLSNIQRIEAYVNYEKSIINLVDHIYEYLNRNPNYFTENETSLSQAPVPQLCSVFRRESSNYVDREKEISIIDKAFEESNVISLYGLSGTGKSELACRYMNLSYKSKKYDYVIWINFRESLVSTIATLPLDNFDENAFLTSLSARKTNTTYNVLEELFNYKLAFLKTNGGNALLVIDNANPLTDIEIEMLLSLPCRIILISRTKIKNIPSIPLNRIDIENGRKLFYSEYTDGDADQIEYVNKLIELVGGHVLSIKLLGRVAQTTGIPLDELANELQIENGELYQEYVSIDDEEISLMDRIDNIFDIFSLSPMQQELLAYMSLIPSSGIKKYEFRKYSHSKAMNEIDKLIQMGWIINDSGTISAHPLVSNCVHHKLKNYKEICEPFICKIIDSLDISGIHTVLHMQDKKDLVKHILSYIPCKSLLQIRLYATAGMFINSVAYQNMIVSAEESQGLTFFYQVVNINKTSLVEYEFALDCLKKALSAYEMLNIKDDLLRSLIYDGLGAVYFNQNQFSKARMNHLQAFALRKRKLPAGDTRVITSARRRSISSFYMGELDTAEQEFCENLESLKSLFEYSDKAEEQIELAKAYGYVGRIKFVVGKKAESLEAFNKSISILERLGVEEIGLTEMRAKVKSILAESECLSVDENS